MAKRNDGRQPDQLRPLRIQADFLEQPHGSVLYSQGKTIVLCTATIEESVPRWLARQGRGWMTAEYSLLPASTGERTDREAARGKQGGRTVEIQRLIGRALRGVVDFQALGERTVYLDCDVLQADGGTRTASITGAWVALRLATKYLLDEGVITADPILDQVAAVSCGIFNGVPVLDLDYEEDSNAEADANFVLTGAGDIVEIQATGEKRGFSQGEFEALFALARKGIGELGGFQRAATGA